MERLCPITDKVVDENVARLNSASIVVLFVLFYITKSPIFVAIAFADFIIRGFWDASYSPITMLSKYIIQQLKLNPKRINAGPKLFAAQVGATISGIVLFCSITGFSSIGCYFAGILVFFAFLEGAFSYCVACKLYPFFRKIS